MTIDIKPMDEAAAVQIGTWDFGTGYEFYNIESDKETLQDFLNGHYYQVRDDSELIGFFCDGDMARLQGEDEPHTIDIGFALRPDLTGRGYGEWFIKLVMAFYLKEDVHYFRLTVASFNKRAIKLYEKMGFAYVDHLMIEEEDAVYHFEVMKLEVQTLD